MEGFKEGTGIRPVKLLLPVDVATRLDEAVLNNLGGFGDRHSLAAAAIDEYLIDLVYANRPAEQMVLVQSRAPIVETRSSDAADPAAMALPAVEAVERGVSIEDTASQIVDAPMLGLHNRDWPSFWALGVLAEVAAAGAVPSRSFMAEVTKRAWLVADQVIDHLGRKAAALLPTNREKVQSAEAAFHSFAVASISRRVSPEGKATVSGPLPLWRAMALTSDGNELCVGVTDYGWDLLESMAGLTPMAPHPREAATSFFGYLRERSDADWWGFDTMLRLLNESPTREKYLAGFTSAREWTGSVASSAAQGYLARGREWGVVEPKIIDGRYHLTDFGTEVTGA